jgi:hypothetical protein
VSVWLWYSLCAVVFCVIVGVGGMLHAIAGEESGWLAIGISVVAHLVNCVGLLAYYLH